MEGARHLEDGRPTVFRRHGTYYARIRISPSAKYAWRSLKTSDEQTAIREGRRLLFQLEQRAERGLPPKSKLFSAVIDDYLAFRKRDYEHGKTSAGMLRQIIRVSKFWREHAGKLPVEAIDDKVMRESIAWRRDYYSKCCGRFRLLNVSLIVWRPLMRIGLLAKYGLTVVFLLFGSSLFGAEVIDESKAAVDRLNRAVASHDCPAQLDYQKELPPPCPAAKCTKDGKLDQKCDDAFWACFQQRTRRMEANNKYNAFLTAECTSEAKNNKAASEADAAKKQANDIEDGKQQRDAEATRSSSCFTTRDLCISACGTAAGSAALCNNQCEEGAYTLHCFKKP
jgi:hypothetical protein